MNGNTRKYPDVGVRFIKRYIEYRGKKGRREIIETVGEIEDDWEGERKIYRYGVLWIPSYEKFDLERYDQFSACEELDKFRTITVPERLLGELRELALAHFFLRVSYQDVLSFMQFQWITEGTRVKITFARKDLPYRLEYVRMEDGNIARVLAENKKLARGASARNATTSIPRVLCHAAYRKAVECFDTVKFEVPGRPQTELFDLAEEPAELSRENA